MRLVSQDARATDAARDALTRRFGDLRRRTEALAAPLSAEDQTIQSMPDVSPTKWHCAHTTWFFETFLLQPLMRNYRSFDRNYAYLFNSYYEAVGPRHPRGERGLLSRPGIAEIADYRAHVDDAVARFLADIGSQQWGDVSAILELGINHEEQHQELLLMDIKHVLSLNPLWPAYRNAGRRAAIVLLPMSWVEISGGIRQIGHSGDGFAFDNEGPRHRVWVEPFKLATRPVSVGEYKAFVDADGYHRPEFWLSDGWAIVQRERWEAPLYWRRDDGGWSMFTLAGAQALDPIEPVCHVSFYEADAFARWSGKRLPTEAEWEVAAVETGAPVADRFIPAVIDDDTRFHPAPASRGEGLQQMFGDVWEWTSSPYVAYPRYRPAAGAIGEYNGKFMSNQMVLRGGAVVTPLGHVRPTYRNFFPPSARWVFGGIRLAEDA